MVRRGRTNHLTTGVDIYVRGVDIIREVVSGRADIKG